MLRSGRAAAVAAAATTSLLLMAACSGDGDKGGADSTPASSPSNSAVTSSPPTTDPNDGKEVLETGCATNDRSSMNVLEPPKQVFAHGLKGTLTLYGSRKCPRITWAHFRPMTDNASAFIVTITMGGRPYREQKSLPGNKLEVAYTVGAKGQIGDKAVGCVTPVGKPDAKTCLETEIV